MSHVFQIPDDLYARLATYAAQHNQTPETLFLVCASEVANKQEGLMTASSTENVEQNMREEEFLCSPLFQITGMFALNEPNWADKHDEYLAEV
jgi:hypothetical protein